MIDGGLSSVDCDNTHAMADSRAIKCGTHGLRVACVVCSHLVQSSDRVLGFVENSSDPNDLQAWCGDCEDVFRREGGMTAAFVEFNDIAVVCDLCYARHKAVHAKP